MTDGSASLYGADLHLHTIFSDGLYKPAGLVEAAVGRRLRAVAVTDHDAVAGVAPTRDAAEGSGVEIVPGIELGTPLGYNEIHIVGLFIDETRPSLMKALVGIRDERRARVRESVRRLERLGIHVSAEKLIADVAPAAPGRVHLATALVKAGASPSVQAAFDRYIGNGMPAYVRRSYPSQEEAIDIIHQAGGVAVFAHPRLTDQDDEIRRLADVGLDAVEVKHPYHSQAVEERYRRLCALYGLLPSGGSDCHGRGAPLIGQSPLSDEELEALRNAAGR